MSRAARGGHLGEQGAPDGPGGDAGLALRMHHALTDLHAYALVLDAQWRRLCAIDPTELVGSRRRRGAQTQRRSQAAEMEEELRALRATIAELSALAAGEEPHRARGR